MPNASRSETARLWARVGHWRSRTSLQTRVGLALALVVFTVVGLVSAVLGETSVDQLRERVGQSLATDARRLAERLNSEMASVSREMVLLAALDPMRALERPVDAQLVLDELRRSTPAYLWLALTNPDGRVVAASAGEGLGTDLTSRVDVREALRGRGVRDTSALNPPDGAWAAETGGADPRPMFLSRPIRHPDGSVAGLVVAQLSWSWVRALERTLLSVDETGQTRRQMFLVAANDTVLIGPPGAMGTRLTLQSIARARAGFLGWTVEIWPDGREYLAGTGFAQGEGLFPGPGSQEMRWTVLVREPIASAFAAASFLRWQVLGVGLMLAITFAAAGWMIAGRALSPLRQIATAADRLRHGDDVELPRVRGAREIEVLANSLRAMVAALTRKELALSEMEQLTRHDPLTKLLNRTGFEAWLTAATARARVDGSGLLLVAADLDGFKRINDTLGHAAGDALLCAVAGRLSQAVRPSDAVARLGGDEFVLAIVAPARRDDEDAIAVARRAWASASGVYEIDGAAVEVGMSAGAAVWPDDDRLPQTVLHCADAALYAAKGAGKNRLIVHRERIMG